MSRWLWSLLGGVVLVAIAALFWTASNQTNVTHPFRQAGQLSLPRRSRRRLLLRRSCRKPRPRLPPHRLFRLRRRLRFRQSPVPLRPRRQLPLRRPMQDSKPPRRLLPRRQLPLRRPMQNSKPPRRLLPRRPPRPPQLHRPPKRPCRRPRPDGRRRKSRAYMRPRASSSWSGPGPIPRRIASGYFSGTAAAGPIASRWTSSPRPRSSSSTKKILLPSATCRIEGASEAEGGLKVSAECQDSISYTSRSVIIALRSATELIYSGMAVNRCRSEAGWVRKVSWNSALKPPGPSDAFGTLRQPGLRPARSRKSSRYLDGASVEPSSAERRSLASLLIWCRRSREMIRSLLKTAKRQMS